MINVLFILNQTWPTESEMAEADASNKEKKLTRKKLPKGTSDYQVSSTVIFYHFLVMYLLGVSNYMNLQ